MKNKIYKLDNGKDFGLWKDRTSKFMYIDSLKKIKKYLPNISKLNVVDMGGANGLLGKVLSIKNYTVVDIDISKKFSYGKFIHSSIFSYSGKHDILILRYVLHYLSDSEVQKLLKFIKKWHKGDIYIIQFSNEKQDLILKRKISKIKEERIEGKKYFRNAKSLLKLFKQSGFGKTKLIYEQIYTVHKSFYTKRLQTEGQKHLETFNLFKLN